MANMKVVKLATRIQSFAFFGTWKMVIAFKT